MNIKVIFLVAVAAYFLFGQSGGGGGGNKYGYPKAGEYFDHVGIFERSGYGHGGER